MVQNELQTDNGVPSKRKRRLQTIGRVFDVLFVSAWLLVYIAALRTGYLSWIGLVAGAFFVGSMVASCILAFAGRKRFKQVLNRACGGAFTLLVVVMLAVALFWPEGSGTWRPYRFDDELAALEIQRAVPDQDNAALRYESVFATVDVNDRPGFFFNKYGNIRAELWQHPWRGGDHPDASQWLDAHSKTVDELLFIGKMENCRWPVHADFDGDYTVPYEKLRRGAELLIAAGNRDLAEDLLDQALEKYACLLSLADHLYQQTDSMDFYYAFGCEQMAMRMFQHVLVESDLSDAQIERITEYMPPSADTWVRDGRMLLNVEKLRYMNLLGRVYEVNDEGDIRFTADFVSSFKRSEVNEPRHRKDRLWRFYHVMNMPLNPKAVGSIADGYFAKFDYLFKSNYIPETDDYRVPSFWSTGSLSKMVCNPWRWCIETIIFSRLPYEHLSERYGAQIAQRRGTWLVFGLSRYRNAHGLWPDSLDRISDYVSPEAFLDPTNGDAFVYAPDGDGFRLYSKGANGIDEGGRSGYVRALNRSEDDVAIWPLVNKDAGNAKAVSLQ